MRPDVGEVAEDLYEYLAPFSGPDPQLGWPLLRFCAALTAAPYERIAALVSDRDERPGWGALLDPDLADAEDLPYLAQFVGARLAPAWSEAERRQAIRTPSGFTRGRPEAIVQAAQRTLTGARVVLIDERFNDSAWQLWVRTLVSETPDPAATEAAVLAQKPIGIVLTYEAVAGQSWADVDANHTDWDDVESSYADWTEVKLTPPT